MMIIQCNVSIKDILLQGKKFTWEKPESCPECDDSVLWGHGFVLCYFTCLNDGIYLKRFRCPVCGAVIKLKPYGYFNKFRTSIHTIKKSLINRVKKRRFLPDIGRNTQYYWLNNLKRNVFACLGTKFIDRLLAGFEKLITMNINPVSGTVQSLDTITI